jgi:hypothetical protein
MITTIFIRGWAEFGEQLQNVPMTLVCRSLVAGITSPLRNWIFTREIPKIGYRSWMRTIDICLFSLITVGYVQNGIKNGTETLV